MMGPPSTKLDAEGWLIAHRGFPEAFPENSIAGVRAALDAGARFVEFDVQLSRDGEPVVIHDATLSRIGRGVDHGDDEVAALDWKTLATRTIGEPGRFGHEFERQRVPHLAEMLALVDQYPGVTAFVEMKPQSLQRFGSAAVVGPVLAEMRRASSPCVAISFDAAALAMIRARGADAIGLGIKPWNADTRSAAERLAPDYLFIRVDRIPAGDNPFWPGDWQWAVYVIDDIACARSLRARGADLIETDRFPLLLAASRDSDAVGEDRV